MSIKPTIVLFRKDLRLQDNTALAEAIELGQSILPVFIWCPDECVDWAPGAASKWFLHQALGSLQAQLSDHGGDLVLAEGKTLTVLKALIKKTGASAVYWNRCYEVPIRERDAEIKKTLREEGVRVESFNSSLLNEPHTVSTGSDKPYKVYTPYWKKVKDRKIQEPVKPDLNTANFASTRGLGQSLSSLNLLPKERWYKKFETIWDASESAAMARLDKFLADPVMSYDTGRDIPDIEGTSSLSPYLHWGLIGPRQIMHRLREKHNLHAKGPQIFAKEIYWREFAYNVLYHFPHTPDEPLQEKYADFPWEKDKLMLKRWQKGQTGYPIVDAGMRQLYETGWMHNRVRMIVSSLLVKHLLQDWKDGARWFWDTLVDADLASNTLGWQWSGGCGADAAPYFRIFNPMTQGKKFDPDGDYVRRWVPELKDVPSKFIHEPWEAPEGLLERANCKLGEDYPELVIEHKEGRARALAALDKVKG